MRVLGAVILAVACGAEVLFEESFEDQDWEKRWVQSTWKGGNGPAGKFEWTAGDWTGNPASKGIMTQHNMRYHSASAKMPKPFSNKGKTLVMQYSVKNERKDTYWSTSFCGGGYIKLLASEFDQEKFGGDTDYKIMFGPDICGLDIGRIHLIFTHKGKNLLKTEDIKLEYDDKNEFTHLYTLVVNPDNTYAVYFDLKEKAKGSLADHWDFPSKMQDDPTDSKPKDWIEDAKMDDPKAKKPDDWVDEVRVQDPEATKPPEWDDDEDGEYEAPMIDNPKYAGAWVAERVANPAYLGVWSPKQQANPDYVEDVYAFDDFGGVGFELWSVNNGTLFDNILVTDSFEHAKEVAEKVWKPFVEKEKEAKKEWDKEHKKEDAGASDDEKDEDEDDDEEAVDPTKEKAKEEL